MIISEAIGPPPLPASHRSALVRLVSAGQAISSLTHAPPAYLANGTLAAVVPLSSAPAPCWQPGNGLTGSLYFYVPVDANNLIEDGVNLVGVPGPGDVLPRMLDGRNRVVRETGALRKLPSRVFSAADRVTTRRLAAS